MSANIVSDLHISGIVGFVWYHAKENRIFRNRCSPNSSCNSVEIVGQILLDENYRSVNYRYQESEQPRTFHMDWGLAETPVNPVALFVLISGLDYQSCETPDWEQSEAWHILQAVKSTATRILPGYEDYPWSLDNGDDVRAARKPLIHGTANRQPAQYSLAIG